MNTKYTNVKAVKVKKSVYRLKKGKTAQIKAVVSFMSTQGTDMQRGLK